MEQKRIYPSTQLVALLHPKVLKVYQYLLGWQNSKPKVYQKQLSKVLKLSEKDIEISIQTLIDNKLIQVNDFEVSFNDISKYSEIPIQKVSDMEQLPVSTEITWNKETKSSMESIDDLTEDQMKLLILRLQASLNEKEQVKKHIKNHQEPTDLPF
jgi:hypothetical protein